MMHQNTSLLRIAKPHVLINHISPHKTCFIRVSNLSKLIYSCLRLPSQKLPLPTKLRLHLPSSCLLLSSLKKIPKRALNDCKSSVTHPAKIDCCGGKIHGFKRELGRIIANPNPTAEASKIGETQVKVHQQFMHRIPKRSGKKFRIEKQRR